MIVALLVSCGGGETEFRRLSPETAIVPELLDFGEVVVGATASLELFVSNGGQATLEGDLSLGSPGGALSVDMDALVIEPNESTVVTVSFTPTEFVDYGDELLLASNDTEQPEVVVPILAIGRDTPVPDIEVSATSLDFGTVEPGFFGQQFVEIANVGEADLDLGTTIQVGSGDFSMVLDPSGSTIAPGAATAVLLEYAPTHTGGDSGTLTFVALNDPDETEVAVELGGNGGSDVDYPTAIIDCPGFSEPQDQVLLDGTASTDPDGLDLDFLWWVDDRPADSAGDLDDPFADITTLLTDVAGDWVVKLQVTNTDGTASAPATCVLDTAPQDEIYVELTWDTNNADLDLHLVEDGSELHDVPGDACHCNPNPDWGTPSLSTDDPVLHDDRTGADDPELVTIKLPADGIYHVKVHYFDDNGDHTVAARVRVLANGAVIYSGSELMQRNDLWEVGQINWPDATFGVLDNPLEPAASRQCL